MRSTGSQRWTLLAGAILLLGGLGSACVSRGLLNPDLASDDALAALYEVRLTGLTARADERSEEFILWRRPELVERASRDGASALVWRLHDRGRISHFRIDHHGKTVISLSPADVTATGTRASWAEIRALVDRESLVQRFGPGVQRKSRFGAVESLAGDLAPGHRLELIWIHGLGLPLRLRESRAGRSVVEYELIDVFPEASAPWERKGWDGYEIQDLVSGDLDD